MTNFDPVSYLMGQKAAGGGGGGGSSTLSGLTDVDISNPTNGQTLVYNATSGKWENGGGILVITVDPATGAMNRTWNEIFSAELAVMVSRMEGIATIWDFVGLCTITSEGGSTYYDVSPASSAPNPVRYRTDSPNGYPTYYSP